MALPFHGIDPIAFHIPDLLGFGAIPVRWYGIAYAVSFFVGLSYITALLKRDHLWANHKAPPMREHVDTLLIYVVAGVMLGGRLGHVILYNPGDYLSNPLQILMIWEGGMSFHGGLLGVTVAILLFARVHHIDKWIVGDLIAASVPVGLFFGRIANFINGEVVGSATSVPWAMEFPGYEGGRHPAMLYEAFLEGFVLFFVLSYFIFRWRVLRMPGLTAGLFLVGYSVFRIFCELFKIMEHRQFDPSVPITKGMVYCIPMLIAGGWLIWSRLKARSDSATNHQPERRPAA